MNLPAPRGIKRIIDFLSGFCNLGQGQGFQVQGPDFRFSGAIRNKNNVTAFGGPGRPVVLMVIVGQLFHFAAIDVNNPDIGPTIPGGEKGQHAAIGRPFWGVFVPGIGGNPFQRTTRYGDHPNIPGPFSVAQESQLGAVGRPRRVPGKMGQPNHAPFSPGGNLFDINCRAAVLFGGEGNERFIGGPDRHTGRMFWPGNQRGFAADRVLNNNHPFARNFRGEQQTSSFLADVKGMEPILEFSLALGHHHRHGENFKRVLQGLRRLVGIKNPQRGKIRPGAGSFLGLLDHLGCVFW